MRICRLKVQGNFTHPNNIERDILLYKTNRKWYENYVTGLFTGILIYNTNKLKYVPPNP